MESENLRRQRDTVSRGRRPRLGNIEYRETISTEPASLELTEDLSSVAAPIGSSRIADREILKGARENRKRS